MEPINYSLDVQTPFQAAIQGYQAGAMIRNDQQQQVALQDQRAAQLQQQQQQQKYLQQLMSKPNPSAEDYANATLVIPGMREQFKQSWDQRNAAQQQSHLTNLSKVHAALVSGAPDIASQNLLDQAKALENSGGSDQQVKALRDQAELIKVHPELGRTMTGLMLASFPGGDKVLTDSMALAKAPAEERTAEATAKIKEAEAAVAPQSEQQKLQTAVWNNANTRSTIEDRSKRLGLDQDKLTTETQIKLQEMAQKNGELPEDVRKDLNTAATDAIAADQSAKKMTALADQLEKEGGGFGVASTAGEWIKKATGNQNEMTRLRAEYNRIATPAAMAAYKKVASGSTSDKDIETAMIGVPKDNADAATMASFLRGAAKLQQYDAVLNNAKSEWLGAVKHLGMAKSDIEVDGVKVPKGTTFKNFSDQYVGRKMADRTQEAVIAASPYASFAASPAPAAQTPMQQLLPVTGSQ